jgi:hypothetical protein
MNTGIKRFFFWVPRVLGILLAIFISLFALDIFDMGYTFRETVLALVMHLISTTLIIIALAIAWHWEMAGGILFIALGLIYIISTWGKFPWPTYLVVAGPAVLTGALFLFDWKIKSRS